MHPQTRTATSKERSCANHGGWETIVLGWLGKRRWWSDDIVSDIGASYSDANMRLCDVIDVNAETEHGQWWLQFELRWLPRTRKKLVVLLLRGWHWCLVAGNNVGEGWSRGRCRCRCRDRARVTGEWWLHGGFGWMRSWVMAHNVDVDVRDVDVDVDVHNVNGVTSEMEVLRC